MDALGQAVTSAELRDGLLAGLLAVAVLLVAASVRAPGGRSARRPASAGGAFGVAVAVAGVPETRLGAGAAMAVFAAGALLAMLGSRASPGGEARRGAPEPRWTAAVAGQAGLALGACGAAWACLPDTEGALVAAGAGAAVAACAPLLAWRRTELVVALTVVVAAHGSTGGRLGAAVACGLIAVTLVLLAPAVRAAASDRRRLVTVALAVVVMGLASRTLGLSDDPAVVWPLSAMLAVVVVMAGAARGAGRPRTIASRGAHGRAVP